MKNLTFITGNQHKADYLAKWLGIELPHTKLDLTEIQSLDLKAVATHKAEAAYAQLGTPVLIEDVALTFHALGGLPGTLVKWFLEELGPAGLCKMLCGYVDRSATASIMYTLYDGKSAHYFEAHVQGSVAPEPRGSHGFGWNPVFIPAGFTKTYGEMTDEEVRPVNFRAQAIEKLKVYLQS